MKAIKGFQGEYRWLSNFWPCKVMYADRLYSSSELAYQAAKTEDESVRVAIAQCKTPGEAKRMGKKIVLRPRWEYMKLDFMHQIVYDKFDRNPELRKKLLATGNAYLEETNNWRDTFWGVCHGEGTNFLGFILMVVRHELRLQYET